MSNMDKDEKSSTFKVVDKRRFNDSGEVILDTKEPLEESKETPSKMQSDLRPPLDFSLFIQTLAHQAMMGLGLIPWPDSGLLKVELSLVKEMVDILKILQEKTKGNLNVDEQSLLDSIVYQLQMAYVENAKGPTLG